MDDLFDARAIMVYANESVIVSLVDQKPSTEAIECRS
jgi:hypothetical protein